MIGRAKQISKYIAVLNDTFKGFISSYERNFNRNTDFSAGVGLHATDVENKPYKKTG